MTSAKPDRAAASIVAGTAALLAVLAFDIGGELDGVRTGVALALTIVLVTAVFGRSAYRGTLPRPFRGSGLLMLMTLFSLLTVLSVGWSVLPGATYLDAVRTIAYTAIVAGAALGAQLLPTRAREVAAGIGLAALLICLYSLLSRVMPGWFPGTDSFARLRLPFEYWNAVGAVAVFGLLAAIWLGSSRESSDRLVAASYPAGGVFLVALALSQSRGAMLVAIVCTGAWLLVAPRRLRTCGWLLVTGLFATAVVVWAYGQTPLTEDHVALADRKHTGALLGVFLVLMIVALAALGYAIEQRRRSVPLRPERRRAIGKGLLVALAISPFVLLGAIAVGTNDGLGTISNGVSDLTDPSLLAPPNSPDRLTQTSSVRARYWNDAFKIFDDHTLHGTGSDTYIAARLPYRKDTLQVRHAHGFVPQVMSDLGVLGLLLAIAMALAFLWSALRIAGVAKRMPIHWLDGADDARLASNTIALVGLAFGLHSAVDWTWFEPGVAAFGLLAAGWTVGVPLAASDTVTVAADSVSANSHDRKLRIARAGAIGLVGLAVAYAVYQPAHAQRIVNQGYGELADGETMKALSSGYDAHDADPTSAQPYFLIATAQNNMHREKAADQTLLIVASQQPANPDTWIRLADYRLNTENDPGAAVNALMPLLYISPNNERGLAMLAQARKERVKQLIDAQIAAERRKLKRQLEKFRREIAKQGGATAATTKP
ncbi:MAG: O-antigen ligase family protein [Solirubrobacterales bacterium]